MARIELRNVSIEFPIYNMKTRSFKKSFLQLAAGGAITEDINHHVAVCALHDVTLTVQHGDRLGLIGHNGAGKSTILRLLAGIYEPTSGDVYTSGHISPMLDIMNGMEIEFTGYENIVQRSTLLGLTRSQIKAKIADIVELTGLGDYLAMPVRTYSSGMMVRLAFAISASISPDILLIDEIFAAGDADFMEKARERMVTLLKQSSIVVMATHADELIKEFCNKVLLLESGRVKYFGEPEQALEIYHSPQA